MDALPKEASAFEREKNKIRKILLGSCKLMDPKMEKNAAYEITPAVSPKCSLYYSYRKTISSLSAITSRVTSTEDRRLLLSLPSIIQSKIPFLKE